MEFAFSWDLKKWVIAARWKNLFNHRLRALLICFLGQAAEGAEESTADCTQPFPTA